MRASVRASVRACVLGDKGSEVREGLWLRLLFEIYGGEAHRIPGLGGAPPMHRYGLGHLVPAIELRQLQRELVLPMRLTKSATPGTSKVHALATW